MNVQNNERFAKVANSVRIEVYETGFADLDSSWRQQDVCSPFSRLYYVISGRGYLRIHGERGQQGRLYELKPGHLYLIPKGLSYDYYCEDRLEKVYMHIHVLLQNGVWISVSIQEIAAAMNTSESTLAKHFRKETGMSIGRYREQLIMNRARQLWEDCSRIHWCTVALCVKITYICEGSGGRKKNDQIRNRWLESYYWRRFCM